MNKIAKKGVMFDETVAMIAHAENGCALNIDMKFAGLDSPVKLLLNDENAIAVRDVLEEYIGDKKYCLDTFQHQGDPDSVIKTMGL